MLKDTNLLHETLSVLRRNHKSPTDILWIGTKDGSEIMSYKDFEILANNLYDNDYGSVYVKEDLVIVGDNWWLERYIYDGAEYWKFKTLPTMQNQTQKLTHVFDNPIFSKPKFDTETTI
jgi:hypothetical protein